MKGLTTNCFALFVFFLALSAPVTAEEADEERPARVQYVELDPAFVANFGMSTSRLKFVKAEITLQVASDQAVSAIRAHDPLIRHEIVMLLSRQSEDSMSSSSGQEDMRKQALIRVQEVLRNETGGPQVEDVLFTSFVIQG